jgi:hypothetical protein
MSRPRYTHPKLLKNFLIKRDSNVSINFYFSQVGFIDNSDVKFLKFSTIIQICLASFFFQYSIKTFFLFFETSKQEYIIFFSRNFKYHSLFNIFSIFIMIFHSIHFTL